MPRPLPSFAEVIERAGYGRPSDQQAYLVGLTEAVKESVKHYRTAIAWISDITKKELRTLFESSHRSGVSARALPGLIYALAHICQCLRRDETSAGQLLAASGIGDPPTYNRLHREKVPMFDRIDSPTRLTRFLIDTGYIRDVRTALDFGCGSGHDTVALAEAGVEKSIGVDTCEFICSQAREKVQRRFADSQKVSIECGCGEEVLAKIAATHGKVDLVLAHSVFHLDRRDRLGHYLRCIRQGISDRGILAVALKARSSPSNRGWLLDRSDHTDVTLCSRDGLVRWFSECSHLHRLVGEHGFDIVEARTERYPEGYDDGDVPEEFNWVLARVT